MAKPNDTLTGVVAVFRNIAIQNEGKSAQAGRPIFDDVEAVELRYPGSKNVGVFPAFEISHREEDPELGGMRKVTYAERFSKQYQQFKSRQHQTKSGTPLDYLSFLTEARRAELRALNIYTAEALTVVDGQELKNLGPGGRELKEKAAAFLAESTEHSRITKLEAEIEALKSRNQVLEEDQKVIKNAREKAEAEYDNMSDDQLRDHVKALTGVDVKGNVPRKTLIRMAQEQKHNVAA